MFCLRKGTATLSGNKPKDAIENILRVVLDLSINWNVNFITSRILKNKKYINLTNKKGQTPLMVAVISKNKTAVQELLQQKVDLNIQDTLGNTALMIASQTNAQDITELLLQAGAQTDIMDTDYMRAQDWTNDEILDEIIRKPPPSNHTQRPSQPGV